MPSLQPVNDPAVDALRLALFFDIRFVIHGERPHHDPQRVFARGVTLDRVRTHTAGFELLTLGRLDLTCSDSIGRVVRDVSKILEAPQCELWSATVECVLLHLSREAESRNQDLATEIFVLHRLRRSGDANRGGRHYQAK